MSKSLNPNPDPKAHAQIPIWNAENWFYEDFELGHRIRSIRCTISEGEAMQFNALVLDMHPYVADARAMVGQLRNLRRIARIRQ